MGEPELESILGIDGAEWRVVGLHMYRESGSYITAYAVPAGEAFADEGSVNVTAIEIDADDGLRGSGLTVASLIESFSRLDIVLGDAHYIDRMVIVDRIELED